MRRLARYLVVIGCNTDLFLSHTALCDYNTKHTAAPLMMTVSLTGQEQVMAGGAPQAYFEALEWQERQMTGINHVWWQFVVETRCREV